LNTLLVTLLGASLIPVFIATHGASLIGLGCQGVLMALILHRVEPSPERLADALALFDLACVRGLLAPLCLYRVLGARHAQAQRGRLRQSLLSWTGAILLVLASFSFAEVLVPTRGEQQTLVAVAAAGLSLGFLVLATQSDPLSQVIGLVRIENAIALLELAADRRDAHAGIQLALTGVFVATLAASTWYLNSLDPEPLLAGRVSDGEGPTL
jgi:hydrogenase-4 component E